MNTTKGNGLDSANDQPFKNDITDSISFSGFCCRDNVRHLRVIAALLKEPRRREDIDRIANCSNRPQQIAELRKLGLDIRSERINLLERDGHRCNSGVYHLTPHDRLKINELETKRGAK
jgi:hypothetical protein